VAPRALAATAGQVLNDWREDGSIDGNYKLSELRAADQRINPQEREYTFWDDAYADAIRRLKNPDAPRRERKPTVPPRDFDNDGAIDADDIARANAETARLRAKRAREAREAARKKQQAKDDDVSAEEPDDDLEPARSEDNDDSGLGWLALLLIVVPAAVIGFGAWRMQRTRKASRSDSSDMDDTMDGFPPA